MTEKNVFIDNMGKICDVKYKIHVTWDVFGGVGTAYLDAQAGSDKALKEFKKGMDRFIKEEKMENVKIDIKRIDEE